MAVTLTIVTAADLDGEGSGNWFGKTRKLANECGGVYFSGTPKSKLMAKVPCGFAFRNQDNAKYFIQQSRELLNEQT